MTMDHETRQRYMNEIALCLRGAGYSVTANPDSTLEVSYDDHPLCSVPNPGGISWKAGALSSAKMEEAKDRAYEIVRQTTEYMRNYDQGQPLKLPSLDKPVRIMADYNGTLLAATESKLGLQFVTWDWDFDRRGVSHGHYFGGNYTDAKQDFATRSGMIPENRLFTPEQTLEIYRCCATVMEGDYDLTYDTEKTLSDIKRQIQNAMPDVEEQITAKNQELECPEQDTAPEMTM
ncbi:MAG: hypothetical protein ACI3W5_07825 [Faecousia sp.]